MQHGAVLMVVLGVTGHHLELLVGYECEIMRCSNTHHTYYMRLMMDSNSIRKRNKF